MSTVRLAPLAALLILASIPSNRLSAQIQTITTATGAATVRIGMQHLRTVASTSDGRVFALVHENDGLANGDASLFLDLWESGDGGVTWKRTTRMPRTGAVRGSLVTGLDGKTLHIVYEARLGNGHASIAYDAWDSVAKSWSTHGKILQTSTSTNAQFLQPVIDVTRDERLVIAYYTHRQGPWSGQMQIGDANGANWTATARVNVDTYGVRIDHQVAGDDAWFAYRTNTGGYGIRARRYDLAGPGWGSLGELEVSGKNANISGTANSSSVLAVDRDGKVWVLWSSGGTSAGTGVIWLSAKASSSQSFAEHYKVDDDAPILGGNNNYDHFSLTLDENGRLQVLYSLLSEQNANLYLRFPVGSQLSPRLQLALGKADDFARICGNRRSEPREPVYALLEDKAGSSVRILVRGSGTVVPHVTACSGTGAAAPLLTTDRGPVLGTTLNFLLEDLGANRPGAFFVGVDDTMFGSFLLPLPLDALGFRGCFLAQSPLASSGFASNSAGTLTIPVPYPNLSALKGTPIFWQAFVASPGANAGGALLTGGLATIAR
ncbi:MAG: hypothetical protein H6832_11345 [Planctomycetes bacterium]|nr:hypothetical protein [Planctomycetota bacterium]MCB9918985.1 hypothetical protein [Planctomycetota bacterium]